MDYNQHSEQSDSKDRRAGERSHSYAKILIGTTAFGYLRDISTTGIQADFTMRIPYSVNDRMELKIYPQFEDLKDPFTILVKMKWKQLDSIYMTLGFELMDESEEFQALYNRVHHV
jgi:hypothetical protein